MSAGETARRGGPRRCLRRVACTSAGLVAVLILAATGYVVRNLAYARWDYSRVTRAGFVEHQVRVDGSLLNYVQGPDNGPAMLLIHGQLTDWRSWNRVLPELSQHYHVFAIDCYGHGLSEHDPDKYSAKTLAADLHQFLTQVVGESAMVIGHSSGGLVAARLAADAPDQVLGVVLEDPPFFSSTLPRAENTFNHVGLATTAHEFLRSGDQDFTAYYIRHDAMWDLFKGAKHSIQRRALSALDKNPGEPPKLFYAPPAFNELFRAMQTYDPRFGEAFYDNTFHQDFDHADTLARITVPAVLIHTNWTYDDNAILLAAMSGDDAERARSLIAEVEFHKVDSGHGFHFEDPNHFERIVLAFAERVCN